MTDIMHAESITSAEALRAHYGEPPAMVVAMIKTFLDEHHQNFIRHSPFVCVASAAQDGQPNVSPKGDAPGFVHILDRKTLIIPDRPGNSKVESFENVIANPKIALIFFIPGITESLRVQGTAKIVRGSDMLALGKVGEKLPPSALVVSVTKAYMHCGKALIRSRLWAPESHVADGVIAPFSRVVKEQANAPMDVGEVQKHLDRAYREQLY